jgi:hypothetical protein
MEIAAITGHAVGDVRSIMDKCYFNRDPAMALRAMQKLEKGTSLQTVLQTVLSDATQKRNLVKNQSHFNQFDGGRTRARTLDPLIKSQRFCPDALGQVSERQADK